MAGSMVFPNDWAKFLENYSFRDHKEFYTNGARLIPTFRVEQMMHHYLRKATEDSVKHGRWIKATIYPIRYVCSECGNQKEFKRPYCEICGTKMDGDGNGC